LGAQKFILSSKFLKKTSIGRAFPNSKFNYSELKGTIPFSWKASGLLGLFTWLLVNPNLAGVFTHGPFLIKGFN